MPQMNMVLIGLYDGAKCEGLTVVFFLAFFGVNDVVGMTRRSGLIIV